LLIACSSFFRRSVPIDRGGRLAPQAQVVFGWL